MAVSRTSQVDQKLVDHILSLKPGLPRTDLDSPVREGTALSARQALALFEAQVSSRMCDLVARELKGQTRSFYTIGSSGHEGNAAVAAAMTPDDPAFLHYRSGAFYLARAQQRPGPHGMLDILLGVVAASDDAISGGRHKVFGSVPLNIPPQTSTIASHLPKALGCALAMDRRARLEGRREDRIAVCTFGDASANHATAAAAFNSAAWCNFQNIPAPVLYVCEDNGIGISVRTPSGWIGRNFSSRPDLRYFQGDGLDLPDAFDAASAAVAYVRERRRPAFLHLRTVRLLGHAGSDVEQLYRSKEEIEATEAMDPLRTTATILVEGGWIAPDALVGWIDALRERARALGLEASARPMLTDRAEIIRPLFRDEPERLAGAVPVAAEAERRRVHAGELPETSDRPRHLAMQLNRALADLLAGEPRAVLFGEDVARKGGVYHVTADLSKRFGVGRVFNTLLDETTILGLAIGAGHAGLLPLPEIQYLAYLANAVDQLRGEAGSMQFFSNGQYTNPMVVRIAGLAYQKGFGGHFHNDNGIGQLLEIPGLLVATPSRGDDGARMLRTLVAAARDQGRVCVFLEPIALYMTKDLHEDGDNGWLTPYPAPNEHLPVGEVGVYGDGTDLCIASFANGLWMSLRVARRLEARGHKVRVIDLRWLSPLPVAAVAAHAQACGRLLIVDECRRGSGIAAPLYTAVAEATDGVRITRLSAPDTYIPLGDAANRVLLQEDEIEAAALAALEAR